jgi:uncharacterized protein YuzE
MVHDLEFRVAVAPEGALFKRRRDLKAMMNKRYLEVTYRRGKPFAAYLYLDRRPDDKAARSERRDDFVVDFADDGRVIGVELIRLSQISLHALNEVLNAAKAVSLVPDDLAPLSAA